MPTITIQRGDNIRAYERPAFPLPLVRVKRVRDAIGARCLDCEAAFTQISPWHWRKSQYLHTTGTGHRTELIGFAPEE